ncbi:PUA-like domain protein [Niveomyces insectorum RCEF 264]|uniref:PUA-like domain protein n=1 Tax=Niveomyces insectorum RCEF 264 TaxID=1081102 RepID=A0A167TDP2_9HYPO|nr:PUA-like domain protein [Niveomyces insectorum RCEF 264]
MPPKRRSQDAPATIPTPTASSTATAAAATVPRRLRSSRPPQQVRFPARRKVIKRYGRLSTLQSPKQRTLADSGYAVRVDDETNANSEDRDASSDCQVVSRGRGKPEDRRRTRRKPSKATPSSFHTQTLTQFLSGSPWAEEAGGDEFDDGLAEIIRDSEDEYSLASPGDKTTTKTAGVPVAPKGAAAAAATSLAAAGSRTQMVTGAAVSSWGATTTPRAQRTEIPSSQPSPFTPILLLDRYHSPLGRLRSSPLQTKNAAAAVSGGADVAADLAAHDLSDRPAKRTKLFSAAPKRTPTRVIPDSYSTAESASPVRTMRTVAAESTTTPSQRRSPLRVLRSPEIAMRSSAYRTTTGLFARPAKNQPAREAKEAPLAEEIADTDDDDDGDDDDNENKPAGSGSALEDVPVTPQKAVKVPSKRSEAGVVSSVSSLSPLSSLSGWVSEPGTPTPLPKDKQTRRSTGAARERSQARPSAPPNRNLHTSSPAADRPDGHSQGLESQGLESQRVPLDVIRDLGPQTDRSDIIISIHPEHVRNIVNGTKDHEFRSYKIPQTVSRFWIYVTRPVCELQYMAVVAAGFRQPGEIEDSTSGLGNADFNAGRTAAKFAYKLVQVYQLNNAVPLAVMKANGWIDGPPQRYAYVPPAVVGALLGNLRCALFEEGGGGGGRRRRRHQTAAGNASEKDQRGNDEDIHDTLSISQEIEAQLLSDMLEKSLSGQQPPVVSSSQRQVDVGAVAATALSPPQPSGYGAVRPSQATTASAPGTPERVGLADEAETADVGGLQTPIRDASSSPLRHDLLVPRPQLDSGTDDSQQNSRPTDSWQRRQLSQPLPPLHTLPSSLTNSTQIALPESLYEEVRQAPPAVILDSEDSEGD